jgi:hypothetical protein
MWQDLMRGLNSWLVKNSGTLLWIAWSIVISLIAGGIAVIVSAQV